MFRALSKQTRRCLLTAALATEYTSLSSGLTVASAAPKAKTSTVGVFLGAGPKFENEVNNGVSKILADAVVAATHDAAVKLGAIVKTSVGKEHVGVYATAALKKAAEDALKLISGALAPGALGDAIVENAKKSALAAAEALEATPRETVLEHVHATAFQGSSLALPKFGTAELIANVDASDVARLLEKNLVSSNSVVVGAGVAHESFAELVEKSIKIPQGLAPSVKPAKFLGSDLRFRDDTLPKAYILIAAEGPAYGTADYYTALVAAEIMGHYIHSEPISFRQGSKLVNFVHDNHLADTLEHYVSAFKDTGLWGFYAQTGNIESVDDLVHFTLKHWNSLLTTVSETEVFRGKALLKTKLLAGLNSTEAVAQDIGVKVLTADRRASVEDLYSKIDAVTADAVKTWAQKALWDQDIAVSGTGQIEALFDYNRLRNDMSMLRW